MNYRSSYQTGREDDTEAGTVLPRIPDATRAAQRAGYSTKTAAAIGAENLKKPKIWQRIQEVLRERCEEADLTADFVIRGLMKEAQREDERSTHSARVAALAHLARFVPELREPDLEDELPRGPQLIALCEKPPLPSVPAELQG